MISGYVIFFSAINKSAGQFLAARALRLFPAFWVAMLFTSIVAQFWATKGTSVSLTQFVANLTMFPKLLNRPFVDGVYWTLNYEWIFYFAVFAMLILGLQSKLGKVFLAWPVYILLAHLLDLDKTLPYADSYYAYFSAGALFALWQQKHSKLVLLALSLSAYLCWWFALQTAHHMAVSKHLDYSELVVSAIIGTHFSIFYFLCTRAGASVKIPGSRLMGGLTYPLYLIHAHFGYMFLSRFANDTNKWLVYPLAIFICLFIAFLIHTQVERRGAKFWAALFDNTARNWGDKLQQIFLQWRQSKP